MISERVLQMNTEKEIPEGKTENKGRKIYICFMDYQKAFDRVKHDKFSRDNGEGWGAGNRKESNLKPVLATACSR